MQFNNPWDYKCKIVLIGDHRVGKSNILQRFTINEFNLEQKPTIGVDYIAKSLDIKEKVIRAQVWDTAGQERFRAIISTYYSDADGALLIYDITDQSTFESLDKWLIEMREKAKTDIKIMLLGNKSDLKHLRQVSTDTGAAYALRNNIALFLETSALDGSNVDQSFTSLIQRIYNHNVVQVDSKNNSKNQACF